MLAKETSADVSYASRAKCALHNKTIVIVGVGALGSVMAELLAHAGVKRLVLIDRDVVSSDNLARQPFYTKADIGTPKVIAAKQHLERIAPKISVDVHASELSARNTHLLKGDLVLDGTDNFKTRFIINDYCIHHRQPWVYASLSQSTGYVLAIRKKPCLSCVFPMAKDTTCEHVTATHARLVAVMALAAATTLFSAKPLESLLHISLKTVRVTPITVLPRKNCPACAGKSRAALPEKLCGKGTYQFRTTQSYTSMKRRWSSHPDFTDYTVACARKNIILFKDGRIIVIAPTTEAAQRIFRSTFK